MKAKLGEAYVEIRANWEKYRKDLDKTRTQTRVATSGMSKNMEKFRIPIARARNALLLLRFSLATIGGYALYRGLKRVWEAAGNQAQALQQLEARIRSTGGAAGMSVRQLSAMAAGLQAVTTYGDESILAMQGVLLSFTNIRGATVRQATEAILDLAAAMYKGTEGGLQQAAIQVGKALHDPIEGVTALRRVGILITEQQREQIKTMVDLGDVAGAQAIILHELQTEFGGTARALRETPWGEAEALSATFGDTLEFLGTYLAKTLKPAIKGINKVLADFNAGVDTDKLKALREGFAKIEPVIDEETLDLEKWQKSLFKSQDQAIDTTVTIDVLRKRLIPLGNAFEKVAADATGFTDELKALEQEVGAETKPSPAPPTTPAAIFGPVPFAPGQVMPSEPFKRYYEEQMRIIEEQAEKRKAIAEGLHDKQVAIWQKHRDEFDEYVGWPMEQYFTDVIFHMDRMGDAWEQLMRRLEYSFRNFLASQAVDLFWELLKGLAGSIPGIPAWIPIIGGGAGIVPTQNAPAAAPTVIVELDGQEIRANIRRSDQFDRRRGVTL